MVVFVYPDADEGYRMESRTALQSPISRNIAVRLSLDDFYVSDPNPGISENDVRLVSSLVCSF